MMKLSNYVTVLNEDGSIRTVKYTNRSAIEDSKYVLIPIEGYGTHIAIKSSKFVQFKRAVVKFRISVYDTNTDGDSYIFRNPYGILKKSYNETVKECGTPIEFYNLMHSISRIDYGNLIYDEYYDNQWYTNTFIYISYLEVTLYGSNNDILFQKKAVMAPSKDEIWHNDLVIEKFDSIYKTITSKLFKHGNFLDVYKDKWEIRNFKCNGLMGIFLKNTDSISFMDPKIYNLFSKITSASYEIIIYTASPSSIQSISDIINKEKFTSYIKEYNLFAIARDYKNIELHQDVLSMNTPAQLIEFINYIPQIHRTIEMIYNTPILPNLEFDTIINLKIALSHLEKSFVMTGNRYNIQTLEELTLKLCELIN